MEKRQEQVAAVFQRVRTFAVEHPATVTLRYTSAAGGVG